MEVSFNFQHKNTNKILIFLPRTTVFTFLDVTQLASCYLAILARVSICKNARLGFSLVCLLFDFNILSYLNFNNLISPVTKSLMHHFNQSTSFYMSFSISLPERRCCETWRILELAEIKGFVWNFQLGGETGFAFRSQPAVN